MKALLVVYLYCNGVVNDLTTFEVITPSLSQCTYMGDLITKETKEKLFYVNSAEYTCTPYEEN